jgi:8-oxo-dGTP pyrophosphatase MutT (NUDIX family)
MSVGSPAPWSEVPLERRRNIDLQLVLGALEKSRRLFSQGSPPTEPSELAAVADDDPRAITRRSAVLVALFEEYGETRLVLTRRSFELSSHRGEVALPGGRSEPHESAEQTALREASEEIDLSSDQVDVRAWLSPIVTFASGSSIQPVIGFLDGRPSLTPNPVEVGRVFDVSLAQLLEEGNFLEQRWRRDVPRPGASSDGTFPIFFFRVPGEVVWGATARVVTELLSLVVGVGWPETRWVVG